MNNNVGCRNKYDYDNQNRLTSASTALAGATENYTYNDDGAILTKGRTGNSLEYKYWEGKNRLNRLINNGTDTAHYAYDTKGNIYGGDGILMAYNFRNQPVVMTNINMEKYNYSYNSNGERTKKVIEADTTGEYYLRDYLGRELVIYDYQSGKPKAANIFGNGLIGRIEFQESTDERFYYLKDHLGSIRATLDQYGTVVSAQDYFPYGETIREYVYGMPLEKYKFNGKERDIESGLDNSVWRYYISKLGLWPQIDPLSDMYPGWSPYNYALCDPVNKFDPDGRSVDPTEEDLKLAKEHKENLEQLKLSWQEGDVLGVIGNFAKRLWSTVQIQSKTLTLLPEVNALGSTAGVGVEGSAVAKSTKQGVTVLGHYPEYVDVAKNLGAKNFDIPTNVWESMSTAEKWAANQKFLDRMVLRGDKVRLATPIEKVKPGSFFERELNYLFEKGYNVSPDGQWLVK